MRYLSVCSGIAAETVAWHALGWECVGFSEVDPQCNAVLARHFPEIPNYGSVVGLAERYDGPTIDLLVGGTPCQPFSVAGLRGGLDDDRGKLVWEFIAIAQSLRPRWLVWENVPGVTSATSHVAPDQRDPDPDLYCGIGVGEEVSDVDEYDADESHAFACFLAALSELGYRYAFRTLDAEYVRTQSHPRAVPQRRRRVFVVGYLGDWRPPVAVLFEPESLSGDPPPSRKTGAQVAGTISGRPTAGGGLGTDFETDGGLVTSAVTAKWRKGTGWPAGDECQNLVVQEQAPPLTGRPYADNAAREGLLVSHTLRGEGHDASEDDSRRGTPIIPFDTTQLTSDENRSNPQPGDPCHTMSGKAHPPAIAFSSKDHGADANEEVAPTLRAMPHDKSHANAGGQVAVAYPTDEEVNADLQMLADEHAAEMEEHDRAIAFDARQSDVLVYGDKTGPVDTCKPTMGVLADMVVRRLTPRECEALQGLPLDHTLVDYNGKPMADGPRYRMIGNAWAVNVGRWLGDRIDLFERITKETKP